jgi:hypothetical protein
MLTGKIIGRAMTRCRPHLQQDGILFSRESRFLSAEQSPSRASAELNEICRDLLKESGSSNAIDRGLCTDHRTTDHRLRRSQPQCNVGKQSISPSRTRPKAVAMGLVKSGLFESQSPAFFEAVTALATAADAAVPNV